MRLFRIEGKHLNNTDRWYKLDVDFAGYYLLDTTDNKIFGYIEEFTNYPNTTSFHIVGMQTFENNTQKLVFAKLNDVNICPMVYSFSDVTKIGFTIKSSDINGFAEDPSGNAQIKIEEIQDEQKKLAVHDDYINFYKQTSIENLDVISMAPDLYYFL